MRRSAPVLAWRRRWIEFVPSDFPGSAADESNAGKGRCGMRKYFESLNAGANCQTRVRDLNAEADAPSKPRNPAISPMPARVRYTGRGADGAENPTQGKRVRECREEYRNGPNTCEGPKLSLCHGAPPRKTFAACLQDIRGGAADQSVAAESGKAGLEGVLSVSGGNRGR